MTSIGDDRAVLTALRWEWRTFGERFGRAEERLGSIAPERVAESDETYLLSAESVDAVKVRDDLMDLKHLEQVERRRPRAVEAGHEVTAADLGGATPGRCSLRCASRCRSTATRMTSPTWSSAAGGALRVVPVHKTRRHFTIGGCMAELTDLRSGDRWTRTIAIESEDPARVIAAVRELGLDLRPNVNVPRGLRSLA